MTDGIIIVVAGGVSISLGVGASFWAVHAYRNGRLRAGWRWLRVQALRMGWLRVQVPGGVRTMDREAQTLSYNCAICHDGMDMDADEEVGKLSCGHFFHHLESDKCKAEAIDRWFCETTKVCPVCFDQASLPVPRWPWQAPRPLTAGPSPAASSSAPPPLEQSSSGSSNFSDPVPLSWPVRLEEDKPLLSPRQ